MEIIAYENFISHNLVKEFIIDDPAIYKYVIYIKRQGSRGKYGVATYSQGIYTKKILLDRLFLHHMLNIKEKITVVKYIKGIDEGFRHYGRIIESGNVDILPLINLYKNM